MSEAHKITMLGTGLIGMWKAFDEMERLGRIGPERPKMFAVQSTGCAPIVKAFNEGTEFADEWMEPETIAGGMRVPKAVGDFLILRAVRESGGAAIAVSDEHIKRSRSLIGISTTSVLAVMSSGTRPQPVSASNRCPAARHGCGRWRKVNGSWMLLGTAQVRRRWWQPVRTWCWPIPCWSMKRSEPPTLQR